MSNFLTNIRLNNLQQEIDNLVLSGPLQNPLLTPLDCGGFGVDNAAFIEAASIITPSFTTNGTLTAESVVVSEVATIGTVDINGDTAGILRVSQIQPVLSSAAGTANTLEFTVTNVTFDGITVNGATSFTQDVVTPLLKVGQIETNTPGDDMTLTGILTGGGTATITGMSEVAGTDIKGTTGSFTSIENISNDGPPQLSFGADVNNHDILNIQNLQMYIGTTSNIEISANPVNPVTSKPSLGLTWKNGSNPDVTSVVYDTVFNVPPSVTANSLAGILAINTSAGGNDITDGGDFTCTKLITSEIASTNSATPVIVSSFLQSSSYIEALNMYIKNPSVIPAAIGTVFDSHYNPPTAVAPVNYTNSPGVSIDLAPATNIFNQKLVTFTLNQGVGNIFTLYIENFAFQTMAPTPPDQNYVLYLDRSDMPVGNYFPNRADKPLSYLNILDVTAAPKNYAFTQSILQSDIGESVGEVSLWVGGTATSFIPYSFVMHFISLLGSLESTNAIGTTVTIS